MLLIQKLGHIEDLFHHPILTVVLIFGQCLSYYLSNLLILANIFHHHDVLLYIFITTKHVYNLQGEASLTHLSFETLLML